MGERERKSKAINVALTPADYAALVEEAARLSLELQKHVTVQDVIRTAIREYLEGRGRKGEVPAGRAG
ncbi:MAG: hypothetical protein GU352_03775 [Acidilobus sp.]|jgi:hypothetical protein|nr:hypothetical protein [Acidilobus sp.]